MARGPAKAAAMFFNEGAAEPLPQARIVRSADERIRVGYFSTDFYDHPVAHLMLGVLEAHDRSQFEIKA